MKKLLLSAILILSASNQAFCQDKNIHCKSSDKKIKITLSGINEELSTVSSMKILKLGWMGVNADIADPDCKIDLEANSISCEDQQLEIKDGIAKIKFIFKEYLLTCNSVI